MACRDRLVGLLVAAVDALVLRPVDRLGAQPVDVGHGPDAQPKGLSGHPQNAWLRHAWICVSIHRDAFDRLGNYKGVAA